MRALGLDPVHDTRAAFRGLCSAMSRPGTVEGVPAPADHAVLAALVDHEVTVATPDEEVRGALDREGRLNEAAPDTADIVHTRGAPEWDVRDAKRGSLTEPSDGATIVYRVDSVRQGTPIRLQGPGVPGTRTAAVTLPPPELRALATAQPYPRGVDAVFADREQVLAVPRSAGLEVA